MKNKTKRTLLRLGAAALVLLIAFALLLLYELSVRYVWMPVFWIYYALLVVACLFVAIYNRGFHRAFIKREELPLAWTEEQKDQFYAEARRWWKQSRPVVLYLILPLCLCYAFDILCLFLWGPIIDLFPGLAL